MSDSAVILESIIKGIEEINETLPPDRKISHDRKAPLYGTGAPVDSLTLTLLIVAVERQIEKNLEATISLVDQTSMTTGDNAFASIENLQNHIERLIDNSI